MNSCEDNKALIRRLFDSWINKKNISAVDEMVTPDYISHESGEDTDADGTKLFLTGLFKSFPDVRVTIDDIVCEGDKVVVRNTWRATDTGGFAGMAPTGKSVEVSGIVIWRIEEGRAAERWAVIDYRSLIRQLSGGSQSR